MSTDAQIEAAAREGYNERIRQQFKCEPGQSFLPRSGQRTLTYNELGSAQEMERTVVRAALAAAQAAAPEHKGYVEEKRCCTICDAKKRCHVCGEHTLLVCSDCGINFGATVYVCHRSMCRDEHERKCYGDKP